MPPRKPTKKALDQATLKQLGRIQITIEASEGNLQRIAAMLYFAKWPTEMVKLVPQQMPWEETGEPPKLEIDRSVVERNIGPLLMQYVEQHGQEKARAMVESFGAERVSKLSDEQLLDLHHALAGEAADA